MEMAGTYFAKRARQERVKAADAASPQARKSHLELALRLVNVATEPASWCKPRRTLARGTGIDDALSGAFPVQSFDPFKSLLEALDNADGPRG